MFKVVDNKMVNNWPSVVMEVRDSIDDGSASNNSDKRSREIESTSNGFLTPTRTRSTKDRL